MEGKFSGKHVLITVGGRGIGFEIAQQFGQQGL
jgi:NAD(P)-dependent dehydrogenase (short-subunit alcohol dehydrogenase family)